MESFSWKLPIYRPEEVYSSIITPKGGLTLPEECLTVEGLEDSSDSFVLTNSLQEGIICLYKKNDFDVVVSNIKLLNSMDSVVRSIRRRLIGEAMVIRIDNNRHIEMSYEHLARLGFEPSIAPDENETGFPIMILKYPNRIEITSREVYEKILEELTRQEQE